MCAGPTQRPARAGPCCPAGSLIARRAAAFSLSTAAAEATGITLSQRSTACLSAAASVSPAGGGGGDDGDGSLVCSRSAFSLSELTAVLCFLFPPL